jgi:hypothetical protein
MARNIISPWRYPASEISNTARFSFSGPFIITLAKNTRPPPESKLKSGRSSRLLNSAFSYCRRGLKTGRPLQKGADLDIF